MKVLFLVVGIGVLVALGYTLFSPSMYIGGLPHKEGPGGLPNEASEEKVDTPATSTATQGQQSAQPNAATETPKNSPVTVTPISHATAMLEWGDSIIYTDPVGGAEAFANRPSPAVILVTDIHGDHLSTSTLALFTKRNVTFVVPQAVKDLLPTELAERVNVLANGEEMTTREGLTIRAMPMYNLPESNDSKHTKGRGNGYILSKDTYRVYVAGDTAGTPEMRALTNIDMAFIPMNLPYTMSVEDAADAVLAFKPKKVYPYHYRTPEGFSDVQKFKTMVNAGSPAIEVILAEWYPKR